MKRRLLASVALVIATACRESPQVDEAQLGEYLFRGRCGICHGTDGRAATPMAASYPNMVLADGKFAHGGSRDEIIRTITHGVPGTPMIGMRSQLSQSEIEAVADYVLELSQK